MMRTEVEGCVQCVRWNEASHQAVLMSVLDKAGISLYIRRIGRTTYRLEDVRL